MNNRKEHYNKKGMYAGYDRNHTERQAEDYYSTPIAEVTNILKTLKIDFSNSIILEPCAGGGHMMQGIENYFNEIDGVSPDAIIGTDIIHRCDREDIASGIKFDFLSDDYITAVAALINDNNENINIDYIIMNPPYKIIEPFIMKSLGIANKGVLMLSRLQFLESEKRYDNILKDYPPSDVYVYVDRISCPKNGNEPTNAIQSYAWFYWDLINETKESKLHWIRRVDKQEN